MNKAQYDAVGTAAAAATLTATYTGNTKTLFAKYFSKLHLDIEYTPKTGQTNRYIEILIETSNDEGTTFFKLGAKLSSTTEVKLYTLAAGIPVKLPADGTSTGGTAETGWADFDIVADYVKISVKEDGAANFGTVYIRATLAEEK